MITRPVFGRRFISNLATIGLVIAVIGFAGTVARAAGFIKVTTELSDSQPMGLYEKVGLVSTGALMAAVLVCWILIRRHKTPLVELTEFAQALLRGDLQRRVLGQYSGQMATLAVSLNTMADSLSDLLAQTNKDKAELLTVLTSMSEGVIATDTEQRILLANDAAGQLLAFDVNAAQGRRLWEVVRCAPVLQAAGQVLQGAAGRVFGVGPLAGRHLEVTVRRFPAPGARLEGLVVVAHDTTQTVQYQELRKEFVANVSHELRTPLSIIKGYAETLREGAMGDAEKGPRYLRTIERHVDQLSNLVNDLLELARLEGHGGGVGRRTAVDLGPVARRTVELLTPAAQAKGQSLGVDVAENLPAVAGDADYLERAVGNLIDNAIKYTPSGGRIEVKVHADQRDVVVEVTDTGIGIPAEDLPRIFERFYRVDRSRSRDMGGTGLGLSIVKHVVQSHGGKVDVASVVGQGSTFLLKLPAVSAAKHLN